MKPYDHLFDSTKAPGYADYQLACGFISTTRIFFRNEQILAVIQSKGHVDFYDAEDHLLASADAIETAYGRKRYMDLRCRVADNAVILDFPIYEWHDNYPHCDGEYDRWDATVVGFRPMRLDLKTKEVTQAV